MNEFCENTVLPLNQTLLNETLSTPHFLNNVNVSLLADGCRELKNLTSDAAIEAKYSQPMLIIGYYIVAASVFFYGPMLVEIADSAKRNQFWVPCNYISLNAAFFTIIAVAIKLPMDLSSPMPDPVDKVAKLGSLGYMCSMLSHVMPSLGSMDKKSLVSNVTALSILVITLIVNVGIQLKTGVISGFPFREIACIYMCMLFFLLIIYVASAITSLTIKKDLESMYHENLNYKYPQENQISTAEVLNKLVTRYWIMADTGNPQFVMASTPFSIASSMISALSLALNIYLIIYLLTHIQIHYTIVSPRDWITRHKKSASVYGLSASIVISQTLVILAGSSASIIRCYSILRFKLLANQNRNHFSVFKVEKYSTGRRSQWKQSYLSSLVLQTDWSVKKYIQEIWDKISTEFFRLIVVRVHKVVVVSCKLIELIPIMIINIFAKCISPYSKMLEEKLATQPTASSSEDIDEDHLKCVYLFEYDKQLATHLLKRSLESFGKVAYEREVPQNNLMKLLEKSVAFDGVEKFDTDQIQPLLPFELVNSWSLPIISLAHIATAIPSVDKDEYDNLVNGVLEGLFFTGIVEESLYKESEYVNVLRATMNYQYELWCTSDVAAKTPTEIIIWFSSRAEEILNEFKRSSEGEGLDKDKLPMKVIIANSMYRTAKTIIHTYESSNMEITEDELFSRLSAMIASIFAACLTNLPRVIIIAMKLESRNERLVLGLQSSFLKRLIK